MGAVWDLLSVERRQGGAGEYHCQECKKARTSKQVTQSCGATLIVCPYPIFLQWQEEIAKHIQPGISGD